MDHHDGGSSDNTDDSKHAAIEVNSSFFETLARLTKENPRLLLDGLEDILSQQGASQIEAFLEGLEVCRSAAVNAMQQTKEAPVSMRGTAEKKHSTCDQGDFVAKSTEFLKGKSIDEHTSTAASTTTVIPVEVIHQVCQSDFLTVAEIGRFLFLVAKSQCQSFGRERAWELVCGKQWRNTVQIPKVVTERRGFEWLFRQRSNKLTKAKEQQIRKAELTHDKLMLFISIYNAQQKEVISLTLQDGTLKKLLDSGELNVSIPSPVPLGKFAMGSDGTIDFDMFSTDFVHWHATMHLLRLDKQQFSCLFESTECAWGEYDLCEDPDIQTEAPVTVKPLAIDWIQFATEPNPCTSTPTKPPAVEVDMGYLEFSSGDNGGLDFTVVGKAYENRIRQSISDGDELESLRIEPTILCFTKDFQPQMEHVELCFSELRLDIWKRYRSGAAGIFHSAKEEERHGISLFHLLDQLNDWED